MASFVRFVFVILIVGMLVNLCVVLLANARSQRARDSQYKKDEESFKSLLAEVSGQSRRADIIVERQVVGLDDTSKEVVTESTLLIRQYGGDPSRKWARAATLIHQDIGDGRRNPQRIVRIVIPKDALQVGGVNLSFDPRFTGPAGEYKFLAGTQLALFGIICGTSEQAPTNPAQDDDRFTFFPRDKVPELLRLDPDLPQPDYFELKLWQYLWSQIPEMPRDPNLTFPWSPPNAGTPFMRAIWLPPAIKTVRRGHNYTAYVRNGGIVLNEDQVSASEVVEILKAARAPNASEQP